MVKDFQLSIGDLEEYKHLFRTETDFNQFQETIQSLSNPSSKYYDWKVNHR